MPDYNVQIRGAEGGAENASVTGLVNGAETAAVVKTSRLSKKAQNLLAKDGRLDPTQAKGERALLEALVLAYVGKPAPAADATAVRVSIP